MTEHEKLKASYSAAKSKMAALERAHENAQAGLALLRGTQGARAVAAALDTQLMGKFRNSVVEAIELETLQRELGLAIDAYEPELAALKSRYVGHAETRHQAEADAELHFRSTLRCWWRWFR